MYSQVKVSRAGVILSSRVVIAISCKLKIHDLIYLPVKINPLFTSRVDYIFILDCYYYYVSISFYDRGKLL